MIRADERAVAAEVRQCGREPGERYAADGFPAPQVCKAKIHLHGACEMGHEFARRLDVGFAEARLPVAAKNRYDRPRHRRRQSVVQHQREQVLNVVMPQKAAIELARAQLALLHQRVARHDRPGLVQAERFGARLPDVSRTEILLELLQRGRLNPIGAPESALLRRCFERPQRRATALELRNEARENGRPVRGLQRRLVDIRNQRADLWRRLSLFHRPLPGLHGILRNRMRTVKSSNPGGH